MVDNAGRLVEHQQYVSSRPLACHSHIYKWQHIHRYLKTHSWDCTEIRKPRTKKNSTRTQCPAFVTDRKVVQYGICVSLLWQSVIDFERFNLTNGTGIMQAGLHTLRQSGCRQLHPMLPEPGPHNSTHHCSVVRLQSISFDHRLTVYLVDGYDRTGTLLYITLDRVKISRRIEQTGIFYHLFCPMYID